MQTLQRSLLLVVLSSSGLLAACDDDEASLRVVHASPGAPAVDVYTAGSATPFATVAYGETSPYVDLMPGDYNLIVRVAGTDTIVYETATINIDDDDDVITAVAAGDVASTDPAKSFRVLPLFENFGDEHTGEARIRIVHASPDAPAVDIDLDDDGSIDIKSLTRFGDTGADGIVVVSGTSLQIGIGAGGQRLTAFTTPQLPSRSEVFVIATGFVADLPREATGLSLLAVAEDGIPSMIAQNPTVYALHVSPDAPALDVRANGVLLYPDLSFSDLVPAQIPPGDYTVTFSPVGNPDITVASARLVGLAAGERYLAIATGMLTPAAADEARFNLTVYQDQFALDAQPRIRAIHSSPDAPTVDISTVTGDQLDTPPLIAELTFTEATSGDGLVVPATPALTVGIAPTRTTTPISTFDLNTSGALHEFVIAAGAATPATDEQFLRLLIVNTLPTPWSIGTTFANQ